MRTGPPSEEPELVALVARRRIRRAGEVVARVQGRIPEELVGRAVESVGAGFRGDVDLGAGAAAETGIIGAGQNFELADGIRRRIDRRMSSVSGRC